jgi:hypothetical protein
LVVVGSGRYRSSDVYLAVKPAAQIERPGGWLFYAGSCQAPQWSRVEEAAAPLFCAGSVGELSVRYNPVLGAWLCLYNDDSPTNGIVARWAPRPCGPWSGGAVIFGGADGFGQFIHQPGVDHTQEGFGRDRSREPGGVYGPYQITRYTRRNDGGTQIYFTMSTWNPYQVMLMTAILPPSAGCHSGS